MNNDLIEEFVSLAQQRRELEAKLDTVVHRIGELEPRVLEEMADAGIPSFRHASGCTVYTERKIWAKIAAGATKEDVVEALKAAGYDMYVTETYNTNSVSALLREWERDNQPLPVQLEGKIEASEVYKAKVRMS